METPLKNKPTQALGRGLSALISPSLASIGAPESRDNPMPQNVPKLPISALKPGKFQPRSFFNEEDLLELSESILKNGVVQPIIVRVLKQKEAGITHEIIAGERRWRAAARAGLKEIPALVMDLDDKQALEVALIENIQRQNLLPLEVAEGYQRLMEEFFYTQEQLSEVIGKSRSQIANFLRLLTLPESVKELLNQEKISVGHARALLGVAEPETIVAKIVKRGLSVRQTETLIKKHDPMHKKPKALPIKEAVAALRNVPSEETNIFAFPRSSDDESEQSAIPAPHADFALPSDGPINEVEKALSHKLGLDIRIRSEGEEGDIVITYKSLNELETLLRRLERASAV